MAARLLIALAAGLALADASIVTLALPPILVDLDTTVKGVAAVVGIYTAVLTAALMPAAWLERRVPPRTAGAAGLAAFAFAGAMCGTVDDLTTLLIWRALQAAGAALALVAAFSVLGPGLAWRRAALLGAAVGPALGGALTQLYDWRAIFLFQAPVAGLAAVAFLVAPRRSVAAAGAAGASPADVTPRGTGTGSPPADVAARGSGTGSPPPDVTTRGTDAGSLWRSGGRPEGERANGEVPTRGLAGAAGGRAPGVEHVAPGARPRAPGEPGVEWRGGPAARPPLSLPRALVALAAVSAALTGVLFLVVLLLVAGWSLEPLAAAAVVSILPVAALAGSRIGGPAAVRAAAGCSLVAGGVLACAWLPGASVGWVVVPRAVAGTGMGLSLGALAGELLPERTPREAAGVLTVRHAGITLVLLLLAPITSAQLDRAVDTTRERGVALLLDAKLPPLDKLELAGPLVSQLDPVDPRDGLRRALAAGARRFNDDPEQRRVYARVRVRADEALVGGIDGAFRLAFLICGGFALVGTLAAMPRGRRGVGVVAAATAGALLVPLATAAAYRQYAPEPIRIADPCKHRTLPGTGGIDGLLQDAALAALDRAACRFGTSREELALALADPTAARKYKQEHGVDPRSAGGILQGLLALSPPG